MKRIKLSDIGVFDNTRGKYEKMPELMASIKRDGLLQPIVVTDKIPNKQKKKWTIVCGHRRYFAHLKLGLKTIKAVPSEKIETKQDVLIQNITENLQRHNTSPFEDGRMFKRLIDQYTLSIEELAVRVSIPVSYIKKCIDIYRRIPKEFRDNVEHVIGGKASPGKISVETAHRVARMIKDNKITMDNARSVLKDVISGKIKSSHVQRSKSFESIRDSSDKYEHIRVRLAVPRVKFKNLMKKYNTKSGSKLIAMLVNGEIEETINVKNF